jgi:hypothetical protein
MCEMAKLKRTHIEPSRRKLALYVERLDDFSTHYAKD